MAKYVPDSSSRRWVIISEIRAERPSDEPEETATPVKDPFAVGNEKASPDEVFRIGSGKMNEPGWQTRVVANKYPITDFHEVFIHSPDAQRDISLMNKDEVLPIFQAYKARFNAYQEQGSVMIFCNFGEGAGTSLSHPHSQLVLLPPQINLDALGREPTVNVVHEDKHFYAYCPEFSQWPYELWITPKKTETLFGDITDDELEILADTVRAMLTRLRAIHKKEKMKIPFSYNYYISPKKDWYLRIIPRFVQRAGFELGTGLSVNSVDPLDAALAYQNIDPHTDELLHTLDVRAHEPLSE